MDLIATRAQRKAKRPPFQGPLHLTYATSMDPHDVRAWSGTVHFIAKSLEDQGVDMDYLGELQKGRVLLNKAINRMWNWWSPGSIYPVERTIQLGQRFAEQIGEHLANSGSHVVFSPSSIPIALLATDRPKAFYTDATFSGILELYPEFRRYPRRYIEEGHYLERQAIATSELCIYSSEWAANSAIKDYGASPDKVRVVPFGSNLDDHPSAKEVERFAKARNERRIELLFLGVSWERKGGDLAVRTTELLNARGIPARLTVVGCEPPDDIPRDQMEVHTFIAKRTPAGQRKLASLIARSHFLLLPTRADCTPIVYSECNAFGVPCITTDVGGTSSPVKDGVNGFTLPLKADASKYADVIARTMRDRDAYLDLVRSSFAEHHGRLNWRTTGARLKELLLGLV